MARQMRVITVERGVDPRLCTLVGFGGGGPAHAAELGREIGITDVLIPPLPGVTSALGLTIAAPRHDDIRTVLLTLSRNSSNPEAIERLRQVFASQRSTLQEVLASHGGIDVQFSLEMRYLRQGHELPVNVDVPLGSCDSLIRAFDEVHRERFGYDVDSSVQIVHAVASGIVRDGNGYQSMGECPRGAVVDSQHRARFDGVWHDSPIVDRGYFQPGEIHQGPFIVAQADTTTVIPPGVKVKSDRWGNLEMSGARS